MRILERGMHRATVQRITAETLITVAIDLSGNAPNQIRLDVDRSIHSAVANLDTVLQLFSQSLGASLKIDFSAAVLSSSHVVLEDIGLVLGRALLEIIKLRMETYGVNGAGSNVHNLDDSAHNILLGISVEGRKFLRLLALDGNLRRFRKTFLLGLLS